MINIKEIEVANIPEEKISDEKKKKEITVLIVEDDKINQFLIKSFIDQQYKVLTTDTSENVIEILSKYDVDVILMDISIKGPKNGFELAEEIKMIEKFSEISIIATTAHVFEKDRQNAIEYKCDDFIPKPFTKTVLLDTIAKFANVKCNSGITTKHS
jgi:CheY-like chemotaxis protein